MINSLKFVKTMNLDITEVLFLYFHRCVDWYFMHAMIYNFYMLLFNVTNVYVFYRLCVLGVVTIFMCDAFIVINIYDAYDVPMFL